MQAFGYGSFIYVHECGILIISSFFCCLSYAQLVQIWYERVVLSRVIVVFMVAIMNYSADTTTDATSAIRTVRYEASKTNPGFTFDTEGSSVANVFHDSIKGKTSESGNAFWQLEY